MDDVLEEALVLSVCKLACCLPFLPSQFSSVSSPVSFCCCCLLIFTDVFLTVFLCVLWVLTFWQTELTSTADAIALRCLLFICHTYGSVFLLTLPVIVMDTLFGLIQHQDSNLHHTENQKDDHNTDEEREEKPLLGYHVMGYLGCLSLWIFGMLRIKWRWKLEEVWTAACLHSTNSLLNCLPNFYSPTLRFVPPCWTMALLYLALIIILAVSPGLLKRQATIMQLASPTFDQIKAENSYKVQMSHVNDLGLSPGSLKSEKNGQDPNGTEKVIPLTLTIERQLVGPQSGCSWAFPCPGADVMKGVVCALAIFVLPMNLSLNIHLICLIEKALQLAVKSCCLSKSVRVTMI